MWGSSLDRNRMILASLNSILITSFSGKNDVLYLISPLTSFLKTHPCVKNTTYMYFERHPCIEFYIYCLVIQGNMYKLVFRWGRVGGRGVGLSVAFHSYINVSVCYGLIIQYHRTIRNLYMNNSAMFYTKYVIVNACRPMSEGLTVTILAMYNNWLP